MEGANLFKAVLDGADLAGAFLYGAQFLNCAQLIAARNWQSSFRDATLGCGAAIPDSRQGAGKMNAKLSIDLPSARARGKAA